MFGPAEARFYSRRAATLYRAVGVFECESVVRRASIAVLVSRGRTTSRVPWYLLSYYYAYRSTSLRVYYDNNRQPGQWRPSKLCTKIGDHTPRTPTDQLLGLGRGDAGAQCSVKGLPSPDGLGSFRGARRSTRARDQAWGPTKRRRTAGANNKARSAAASDGAFRGVSMRRRDVVESPFRAH